MNTRASPWRPVCSSSSAFVFLLHGNIAGWWITLFVCRDKERQTATRPPPVIEGLFLFLCNQQRLLPEGGHSLCGPWLLVESGPKGSSCSRQRLDVTRVFADLKLPPSCFIDTAGGGGGRVPPYADDVTLHFDSADVKCQQSDRITGRVFQGLF